MFSLGFLLEFDVGFKWKNLGTWAFYICAFYLEKECLVELDEFLECIKFHRFMQGKIYPVLSYRHLHVTLQAGQGLEETMNSEALVIRQIFERFDSWAAELLCEPSAAFVPLFLHLPSAFSKYSLTSLGQMPFFASVCSVLHSETPFLATLVMWTIFEKRHKFVSDCPEFIRDWSISCSTLFFASRLQWFTDWLWVEYPDSATLGGFCFPALFACSFSFFFCNRLNDLFQFCVPQSTTSPDTRAKESIKFLFINKIMSKHFRITGMRSGTGGPDT